MNWSNYQQNIFDFLSSGRGDGVVNAVAGAGKTTVLVESAKLARGSAIFCAFNKHIADALAGKLTGTSAQAKTIHGIGMGTLYQVIKPHLDDNKYRLLCREWVDQNYDKIKTADSQPFEMASTLRKLVNFARLTLADADDVGSLYQMALHYGLTDDWSDELALGVACVLADGQRMARTMGIIDFTDQLYLPAAWNLQPRRFQYVFVDECQDLSAAQLALVMKLRDAGGRMMFVGDPNQAIQSFAGADNDSFWKIKGATGATELPLSICYRCPSSHVDLARRIVPQIEASPTAAIGTIDTISEDQCAKMLRSGDLVLCRRNAPLISLCIDLIGQRIPARVRGRDVGKELAALVRKIGSDVLLYATFPGAVDVWKKKQLDRLQQTDGTDDQIADVMDRTAAMLACYDGFPTARSVDNLSMEIERMFADTDAAIWLSSIHRAKGLEENRVFILHPAMLGQHRKNELPWQFEQELNLEYVAKTRSKSELYFVESEK